ncbi:MAG: arylsulfatase [Bacteroidales bacterium]
MQMKLDNPKLIGLSLAGLIVFPFGCQEERGTEITVPEKPNILIILPDDLGWADVGYHGSDVRTPNIDKLAKTGIMMSQHYVMPTCTPSRVSLMTGLYASRYGVLGPAYGEVIDLGDPTLPSILSEHGYFTAIDGKWHMGSPPYTPLKYGFKSSYGYFDGQIDPYTHEYKTETELTDRRSWHRDDQYLDESGTHVTDLITAEAIRIIEEDREEPFFLYVAHHVPHFPLDEPDEWMSVYDDVPLMHSSRRLFAASVTHMDDAIGKIIDALERTGKRENTIIIFISDNGGQFSWHSETEYHGDYADKPHSVLGNNYPLRGWKGQLYEGGIRVPALINWPGQLEPGIFEFPVHVSDWLPTICALAGIKQNLRPDLDGQNIWPMLTGEQSATGNRTLYWKTNQTYAVRAGNWKMLVNRNNDNVELFDLENDFRENQNLRDANPQKVEELMEILEEFKKGDRELESAPMAI